MVIDIMIGVWDGGNINMLGRVFPLDVRSGVTIDDWCVNGCNVWCEDYVVFFLPQ